MKAIGCTAKVDSGCVGVVVAEQSPDTYFIAMGVRPGCTEGVPRVIARRRGQCELGFRVSDANWVAIAANTEIAEDLAIAVKVRAALSLCLGV